MARELQTEWVKKTLLRGARISALTAFNECGTMRLAAIVHRLKNDMNWDVRTLMQERKSTGARYAVYYLPNPKHPNK